MKTNEEIKKGKRYKKLFIVSILFLTFLTVLLLEPFSITVKEPIVSLIKVIKAICEALIATLIVSVLIYFFTKWVNPKMPNADMEVLHPRLINTYHLQSRMNTKTWWYNGNRGEYTRNVTLPYLAETCRKESRSIRVNLHILHPDNEIVCKTYTEYRNNLSDLDEDIIKEKTIQDLLATIVAAYLWKEEQPYLDIKVYLKNNFSPIRIEMSDSMVIITREDPRDPAIVYQHSSLFYNIYNFDLAQGVKQDIPLDMTIPFVKRSKLTNKKIKELLTSIKITPNITDDDLNKIKELSITKTTPYVPGISSFIRTKNNG